jgi:opacity protein-like surface antigen
MRFLSLAVTLVVLLLAALPGAARAEGSRNGLQEMGVMSGYGWSDRDNVQFAPLFVHFGWYLPDVIDEPLSRYHLNLKWVVEPWVAGITNHQNAIELGVSPLLFKLDYDAGQTVVPFFFGGEGVLYTGLQGVNISGPFEFSSFAGAGVHFFLTDQIALSLSYRLRHISNAGIKHPNHGLNTQFVLIGLEKFPNR